MKIRMTVELNIVPIWIKDASEANAERVGNLINNLRSSKDHASRELVLQDYKIIPGKEGMVIFVSGCIGNYEDYLLIEIAGTKREEEEPFYETVSRARKSAYCMSEKQYTDWVDDSGTEQRFFELENDLVSFYTSDRRKTQAIHTVDITTKEPIL